MHEVRAKFLKMRKEQEFTVYPRNSGDPDTITIQSDKSIAQFNVKTRKGRISTKGCYFYHLAFAVPFEVSENFVNECLSKQPNPGDKLGDGVVVIGG
jgi:hypothetical protein